MVSLPWRRARRQASGQGQSNVGQLCVVRPVSRTARARHCFNPVPMPVAGLDAAAVTPVDRRSDANRSDERRSAVSSRLGSNIIGRRRHRRRRSSETSARTLLRELLSARRTCRTRSQVPSPRVIAAASRRCATSTHLQVSWTSVYSAQARVASPSAAAKPHMIMIQYTSQNDPTHLRLRPSERDSEIV